MPYHEVPSLQVILIKMIHIFAQEISRDSLGPIHKASGVCHRTGGCSSHNQRKSAKRETDTPVNGRRLSAGNQFSAKTVGFFFFINYINE